MGLVIGITACCCAYCAIKKKKKQKRKRLANGEVVDEENGLDAEAEIPVDQSMIRVDDATEDEVNVDVPLQSDGNEVGMDKDPPDPPPSYHTVSVPMGTVLEELDEENAVGIGVRKHSSKKVKYSHLSESAKISNTTKEGAQETSKSDKSETSHVVSEGDAFMSEVMSEVIDKMSEIEEEGAFEGGGKKQSSKKYKYSPLKGSTAERKRVKSGDSQNDHEEISWSNDVYIDEPPTQV